MPSEKLILSHSLDRGGMLEPVLRSDIGDALKEAIGNTVRCDEMGGGGDAEVTILIPSQEAAVLGNLLAGLHYMVIGVVSKHHQVKLALD